MTAVSPAQRRALEAVQQDRCWKWTTSGAWEKPDGIHGTSLTVLRRRGLIVLVDPKVPSPWRDAALTEAGREALEGMAA